MWYRVYPRHTDPHTNTRTHTVLALALVSTPSTVALTVDLDDCTPVYDSHGHDDKQDLLPVYYTYHCRCSDMFIFNSAQLENGIDIAQCNGCTERCRVEYSMLEEEEAAQDDES